MRSGNKYIILNFTLNRYFLKSLFKIVIKFNPFNTYFFHNNIMEYVNNYFKTSQFFIIIMIELSFYIKTKKDEQFEIFKNQKSA